MQWGISNNTPWQFPISFTQLKNVQLSIDTTGGTSSVGWYCHGYNEVSITSIRAWNADNGSMSIFVIGF